MDKVYYGLFPGLFDNSHVQGRLLCKIKLVNMHEFSPM